MPVLGPRCYELRIRDASHNWRLIYRIDPDAIVIADAFDKKTGRTPTEVIESCRRRLRDYDAVREGESAP
jgi:phage-related protein